MSTTASLYRSTDGQAWARIARLTPDGSNRISYQDAGGDRRASATATGWAWSSTAAR